VTQRGRGDGSSEDAQPRRGEPFESDERGSRLGQERGPRFGSFVALYGIEETRMLIAKALAGELAPTA